MRNGRGLATGLWGADRPGLRTGIRCKGGLRAPLWHGPVSPVSADGAGDKAHGDGSEYRLKLSPENMDVVGYVRSRICIDLLLKRSQ